MTFTLTKDTKVTIGFMMTVLGGIVWLLLAQFGTSRAIYELQRDILEIRRDIQVLHNNDNNKINRNELHNLFQLLQAKNPTLQIPEIK